MTDTRKECEQWQIESGENYADGTFDESYFLPFDAGYKACQSLNDKRIEQLLAVIEKQRELFYVIADYAHKTDFVMSQVNEALALQPSDVELSDIGYISEDGAEVFLTKGLQIDAETCGVPVTKLYTIKTKE